MSVGRRVLVPVANPASVGPLLALAIRLTDADDGLIVPVTVVGPHASAEAVEQAEQGIATAGEVVVEHGGRAAGRVVRAEHAVDGVLEAVRAEDATLVVMGWRGRSSTSDVFGRLIDSVVGRSSVPLAIVRLGATPYQRVLLPVSSDHLLPGGRRGLDLAVGLADRLSSGARERITVLRTGSAEPPLPDAVAGLGDRVHHDPRRIHHAVGAAAQATDLVVAAVAPTVSGLRAATTHLAWATPDATLLVAVDVGPTERGIVEAVDAAGRPAPRPPSPARDQTRIVITARLPDDVSVGPEDLDRVLRTIGTTEHLMAWWPTIDTRPHVRATVSVCAATANAALSRVMIALNDAPEFRGAEITYDLERTPRVAVSVDGLTVGADDAASPAMPHDAST
jgi:hypothetical protein